MKFIGQCSLFNISLQEKISVFIVVMVGLCSSGKSRDYYIGVTWASLYLDESSAEEVLGQKQ